MRHKRATPDLRLDQQASARGGASFSFTKKGSRVTGYTEGRRPGGACRRVLGGSRDHAGAMASHTE